MEHITAAGNTEIPAFLTLRKAGFKITARLSEDNEMWIATRGDFSLSAPTPLQLLGLYSLAQREGSGLESPRFRNRSFPEEFLSRQ
jgi:hypothetical protein